MKKIEKNQERIYAGTKIEKGYYFFGWLSPDFERGPYVDYEPNRSTCHVFWGDGSLHRYHEYATIFDGEGLSRALQGLFYGNIDLIGARAALYSGGVLGTFMFCPKPLAETVFHTVYAFTLDALKPIADLLPIGTDYEEKEAKWAQIKAQRIREGRLYDHYGYKLTTKDF